MNDPLKIRGVTPIFGNFKLPPNAGVKVKVYGFHQREDGSQELQFIEAMAVSGRLCHDIYNWNDFRFKEEKEEEDSFICIPHYMVDINPNTIEEKLEVKDYGGKFPSIFICQQYQNNRSSCKIVQQLQLQLHLMLKIQSLPQ